MRKFFGILMIIGAIMMPFITSSANVPSDKIFGPIIFTIILLIWGIKLVNKKKVQRKFYGGDFYSYDSFDEKHVDEHEYEESQEPVSVVCSGCGAKAKVYPNRSTDCEYCGTTVKIS